MRIVMLLAALLLCCASCDMGRVDRAQRQQENIQASVEFMGREAGEVKAMETSSVDPEPFKKKRWTHANNIERAAGNVQRAIGLPLLPPPGPGDSQTGKSVWLDATGGTLRTDATRDRSEGTSPWNPVIPGAAPAEEKPGWFERLQYLVDHWWVLAIGGGLCGLGLLAVSIYVPGFLPMAANAARIVMAPVAWLLMLLASLCGSGTARLKKILAEKAAAEEEAAKAKKTARQIVAGVQRLKTKTPEEIDVNTILAAEQDADTQEAVKAIKSGLE